jgi:hypothetical protein
LVRREAREDLGHAFTPFPHLRRTRCPRQLNPDETLPSAWGTISWKPLGRKRRNMIFLHFAGESGFYGSGTSLHGEYLLQGNVVEIQPNFELLLNFKLCFRNLGLSLL